MPRPVAHITPALAVNGTQTFAIQIQHPDGDSFVVHLGALFLKNEQKQPKGNFFRSATKWFDHLRAWGFVSLTTDSFHPKQHRLRQWNRGLRRVNFVADLAASLAVLCVSGHCDSPMETA